jgi:hypothetical protein
MFHRLRCLCMAAACTVLCAPATSYAAIISFEAIDLDDLLAGEDLWSYRYVLSGDPLQADQGFAIFFDHTQYSSLQAATGPASWDVLLLQPDLNLPSNGVFDALNLGDGVAGGPFTVNFIWNGGGALPGAQLFEVYSLDGEGLYTPLESSMTIAATPPAGVPEPATLAIVSVGLLAGTGWRRFRFARKPVPASV